MDACMHGLMWIFAHSLWLYKANTYTRRSSLYTMTIPLILASKSKPRRDILFHAGICPTIRVSHVDEDAVLARAAQERGITVDELPIDTKVMLLAEAKALAVYEAYLAVAKTAREARGGVRHRPSARRRDTG